MGFIVYPPTTTLLSKYFEIRKGLGWGEIEVGLERRLLGFVRLGFQL